MKMDANLCNKFSLRIYLKCVVGILVISEEVPLKILIILSPKVSFLLNYLKKFINFV
jgi:hypothetical protein